MSKSQSQKQQRQLRKAVLVHAGTVQGIGA